MIPRPYLSFFLTIGRIKVVKNSLRLFKKQDFFTKKAVFFYEYYFLFSLLTQFYSHNFSLHRKLIAS